MTKKKVRRSLPKGKWGKRALLKQGFTTRARPKDVQSVRENLLRVLTQQAQEIKRNK